MKPIFLVGYMASGKTTFGNALAKKLERNFIDLDFYITQRFRANPSQIFAAEGEGGFRKKEAAMIREVGEFNDVVISCGGGTPCFHENMEYMLSRGTVVWLEASEERIVNRILLQPSSRPLASGKTPEELLEFVRRHYPPRIPHYSRAHIRFSSEQLEDRKLIDKSVETFLREHPTI